MSDASEKTGLLNTSQLWQLPLLVLGVVLLVLGVMMAKPEKEVRDFQAELEVARQMLVAGRHDDALKQADKLLGSLKTLKPEVQGAYHLLRGDILYHQMKAQGLSGVENYQKVLDSYVAVYEKQPGAFDVNHLERLALTFVAVGNREKAVEVLAKIGEDKVAERHRVIKAVTRMVIDENRKTGGDGREALRWLNRFRGERGLSRANEVWIVEQEVEILQDDKKYAEVISLLLTRLPKLQLSGNVRDLGRLRVMLGDAYLRESQYGLAEQSFELARKSLGVADAANADALVGLGKLKVIEGNVADGKGMFDMAVEGFPDSDAFADALIGRAEASGRMGQVKESLVDYGAVYDVMMKRAWLKDSLFPKLVESLEHQHDLRFGYGNFDTALDYMQLIDKAYGGKLPAHLVLKYGKAHESYARDVLGHDEGDWDNVKGWEKLGVVKQAEVLTHLKAAAKRYYDHAQLVSAADNEAYMSSLWLAGDLYDFSGDYDPAVKVFTEFVKGRANDPRTLSARHRLAEAYRAAGDLDNAIDVFTKLIDEHPKSPEAYRSLIPYAQAYLRKGVKYSDKAEDILLTIVENHPVFRPESTEYRDALKALGRLYYRRGGEGDYEKAISRLNEIVARYGDDEEMPELQFVLADSYRKSVDQLDVMLKDPLSPAKKKELVTERESRMEQAKAGYDQVIALHERLGRPLDKLESLYLRNSYFYRADCMYAIRRFEGQEGAIELYGKAVQKYEKDPAVLVGLIQVVNCYSEIGDQAKARAANERAKWHLAQIPESAFDDPNLPMNRKHWQRWLDWTSQVALSGVDTDGDNVVKP